MKEKTALEKATKAVKKSKKKFTKKQIKKLKVYWKELRILENKFGSDISTIEKKMQKSLKIEDVEFFCVDGEYCGIGNVRRTMELIASYELEK